MTFWDTEAEGLAQTAKVLDSLFPPTAVSGAVRVEFGHVNGERQIVVSIPNVGGHMVPVWSSHQDIWKAFR